MSMLSIIFAYLGFLISPWGLLAILAGFLAFFLMPVISLVSRFKQFSQLFLALATFPLKRLAVVISEHNDAYLKQMEYMGLGFEKITIDDEVKIFEDPDNALHHWRGLSFALADEEHGVLFDPRHAAAGARKEELDKRGEGEFLATEAEWEDYGVAKWKPAFFEMPSVHEILDLSKVQNLIDGGERSEFAKRIEELYKNSRDPFDDSSSVSKYLFPVVGFLMTFCGIWFMVSQFGIPFTGGGGGAAASETVSYGNNSAPPATPINSTTPTPTNGTNATAAMLMLLLAGIGINPREIPGKIVGWFKRRDWRLFGAVCLLVGTPLAVVAGLVLVFGPLLAGFAVFNAIVGFLIMPILTILTSPSTIISGAFSKLYFRLGFMGYRQPVFNWTRQKYEIVERDSLNHTGEITWYSVFGTDTVGFTFPPEQESWGPEYRTSKEVESYQPAGIDTETKRRTDRSAPMTDLSFGNGDALADGGRDTHLPKKYVPSNIKRDVYGGFIPRRVKKSAYYLYTPTVMGRFKNSANGEKSLRKLLEAKEKHGEGGVGADDATIAKMTAVTGMLGALSGIVIFIVPAFL